jgi:TnpA family transposase
MCSRSPNGVERRRAPSTHGSRVGSRRAQRRGAGGASGLAGRNRSRSPLSGMRVLTVHINTEIVFALCHLLGFYFMPRIRDLKDQQLYRVDRHANYGVFTPLLTKTADLAIVEEQWEEMMRVALSLKQRTAPAHVIVQRLTNSFPADRLAKAVTNLGRIIKTQYILRYLTDLELRRTVQLQLNKGEYRHKLPRRIFFANQGEFTTGDYEEIMNKASCLSLVSNAVLYWNTMKINDIVEDLRQQGEAIDTETLSHISLLPFRHVIPNGTYFIEDRAHS